MKQTLNQWLAFIDGEEKELLEMAKENNEKIVEADEFYNVLTGDKALKRLEEIRIKDEMEKGAALDRAMNDGENKKAKEIAIKLLKTNMDVKQVSEITGLTEKEVQELQANQ